MDAAPIRRGRPSTHMQFARWHRERALAGSAQRFGESAAVLLGDLCLVWSEQMLRDSGLDDTALSRAWPRYDAMRTELAVGQFADLVNDAGALPTLNEVLDVSRRKSGNYTVRRPLEIGAALAGCGEAVLRSLSDYGEAVGEAFQLRDDLLGVYGSPAITGKPIGGDLRDGNATSVVVAAYHLARGSLRRDLAELMSLRDLAETDIAQWQRLIIASGALALIEQMIEAARACAERHRRCAVERSGRGARWPTWLAPAPSVPHEALVGKALMRTVTGNADHVVVVGAGLAGLAAALHLAGRGRPVTVVERGQAPGGRVGRLDVDGYRLDTGPTVLTMPDIIDETFAAVGESTRRPARAGAGVAGLSRVCSPMAARSTSMPTGRGGRRGGRLRRAARSPGLPAACVIGSRGSIEVEFDGFIAAELRFAAVIC